MNINLNGFDVVVINQVGDSTSTICYKKFSDYKKDLVTDEKAETEVKLSAASFPFLDVEPRCCKERTY